MEKQRRDKARSRQRKIVDKEAVQLTELEAFFVMKGKAHSLRSIWKTINPINKCFEIWEFYALQLLW